MEKRLLVIVMTILIAMTALFILLGSVGSTIPSFSMSALAAPLEVITPTVTSIDPTSAPNDLDTSIVVTGSGFTAGMSGTLIITQPTAYLGATALHDVSWVSTTTLSATLPWGMIPQVYSLTVVNPDGISATLQNAFTVTQGIGIISTGGPYGGYVFGVEKKPGIPTTVYALTVDVGLFVSEDSGGTWNPAYSTDGLTKMSFDAQDADVMYLGCGAYQEFARSMDGGQTWETAPQLGFPVTGNGKSYPAAHPTDAGTVFVVVGDDFAGRDEEEFLGGVFRSDDYGMTWITKTDGMTDTNVHSIAIHPNDPDKMLAGTWKGNVYASLDGGENWSLSVNLHDPVAGIYFNPYQPLEAWVTGGERVGEPTTYLYTSANLTDWTEVIVEPGAVANWPCYWAVDFLTDTIWVGGSGAYTSTDGGATWTAVPGPQDDVNVVAITPENPQEIYVGTGGGVEKSEDGGQTWQQINNGLAGITPHMIAVPRTEADSVYVDTAGQGFFRSFNGGRSWQDMGQWAGGYPRGDWLAADPYTPTRVYLGMTQCDDDLFCIGISPDAGETWNLVTTTLPVTFTAGWQDSTVYAITPHPQIPGRILAGSAVWGDSDDSLGMVFASDDYGQSWAYMGPTQPISWPVDIAYDAVDPNLVYMATAGSGHWKSTDGGATWRALPFTLAGDNGDEIAPHPTLSGHLILFTSDQEVVGLYSSQDAGETWTLLNESINSPLVYAPTFPPTLYGHSVIDHQGVLVRSFDNGQTWEQVDDAPYPTSLATASDGERVVLYIGSAGGMVSQVGTQAVSSSNAVLGQSTIFGGGVYRLTTILPTDWVYLPLVLRGHTP